MLFVLKVGPVYAASLKQSYKLKAKSKDIQLVNYRAIKGQITLRDKQSRKCHKVNRVIYQMCRAFYCSVMYYFIPLFGSTLPWLAISAHYKKP